MFLISSPIGALAEKLDHGFSTFRRQQYCHRSTYAAMTTIGQQMVKPMWWSVRQREWDVVWPVDSGSLPIANDGDNSTGIRSSDAVACLDWLDLRVRFDCVTGIAAIRSNAVVAYERHICWGIDSKDRVFNDWRFMEGEYFSKQFWSIWFKPSLPRMWTIGGIVICTSVTISISRVRVLIRVGIVPHGRILEGKR